MKWTLLVTLFSFTLVFSFILWYKDFSYTTSKSLFASRFVASSPISPTETAKTKIRPPSDPLSTSQKRSIIPRRSTVPHVPPVLLTPPSCNNTTPPPFIYPSVSIPSYMQSALKLWPPFRLPINEYRIPQVDHEYSKLPLCSPVNLGPVFTPRNTGEVQGDVLTRFKPPRMGGMWYPPDCRPHMKVAIMVPYRNRAENLYVFTHHMHFFLQQQKLDYAIFVIEQLGSKKFNRAKLFNAGYQLIQATQSYDCFVLHDIDKMPEDTRALYHCDLNHPKQMPSRFRTEKNAVVGVPYKTYFGGVTSLSAKHYEQVNGMTNEYWGWGGEDDELLCRVQGSGLSAVFESSPNAIFSVMHHKPDAELSGRPMPDCRQVARNMRNDGLRNVDYKLESISFMPLYTVFKVIL